MEYFKGGYSIGEFLFKGFVVETPGAFAATFIGLVSSAILFEGLRIVRDFLLNRFTDARKQSIAFSLRSRTGSLRYSRTERKPTTSQFNDTETSALAADGNRIQQDDDDDGDNLRIGPLSTSATTPYTPTTRPLVDSDDSSDRNVRFADLFLSTFIHMIYITLGYCLMLAVMTFNVWVLVAIAIGIAIGYFVFGTWRRFDNLSLDSRTLITGINCREVSSEKTASTNSDSVTSMDGKTNRGCANSGASSSANAHVTADVDVHCSKLLED